MTLTKFNNITLATKQTGIPALKIHRKDAFCLNWEGVALTGFKAGDKVSIIKQESQNGPYKETEWYLVKDDDGFELKGKDYRKHLVFSCNKLANVVLNANSLPEKVYSVKIAPKSTKLEDGTIGWCLLMGSAK